MQSLKGKKLLYLGGIARARWVVKRARELGIYVIVADYNDDSPAKEVADEGVLLNATDVDALVSFGAERRIDGIMTGYCDILLPVCREVANRLKLPCYMSEDMIRVTTDKEYFKEVCNKYAVPVPKAYNISSDDIGKTIGKLKYPVFIKPIDASGARGASACYSSNDFLAKYEEALSFSASKRVLVEECLSGTAFILDYALIEGKPCLLSMADCYSCEERPAAINSPNLMIMPSKYIKRFYEEVNPHVKRFFTGNNFNNGIFFFQGYANSEKITFYEAGCRLGGTWPYIDEYFYGINPLDMLFSHALEDRMLSDKDGSVIDGLFNGMAACIYFLANSNSGRVISVKGVAEVKRLSYVVNLMQYYHEGDEFDMVKERCSDIRFLSVHLVADNYDELIDRIEYVYSKIEYIGVDGKSLLAPVYNVKKLSGYKGE